MSKRTRNRDWLLYIKMQPCLICNQDGPSEAHHLREHVGMGRKASDHATIPLCQPCHRDYHAGTRAFRRQHGSDLELLERTLDRVLPGLVSPKGDF